MLFLSYDNDFIVSAVSVIYDGYAKSKIVLHTLSSALGDGGTQTISPKRCNISETVQDRTEVTMTD